MIENGIPSVIIIRWIIEASLLKIRKAIAPEVKMRDKQPENIFAQILTL